MKPTSQNYPFPTLLMHPAVGQLKRLVRENIFHYLLANFLLTNRSLQTCANSLVDTSPRRGRGMSGGEKGNSIWCMLLTPSITHFHLPTCFLPFPVPSYSEHPPCPHSLPPQIHHQQWTHFHLPTCNSPLRPLC